MAKPNEYIDIAAGLSRVRGNKPLYANLLKMFLKNDETVLLKQALERKDNRSAYQYAHALKGLSGNLSLTALYEASAQLASELKYSDPSPVTVQQLFESLEQTCLHLETVIKLME